MLLLRKLAFYFFVTIYVVACPLTIAYALGYLVQPGAEQGLVKTGLVHLATAPGGASVYLGRRRYTERTPATLRGLLPGTYSIAVTLRGYRPWRRTVSVEAGRATVFDRIVLLPQTLVRRVLIPERCEELLPVADPQWLVVRRGPLLKDLLLYDIREATAAPLPIPDRTLQEARIRSVIAMRDGPGLLLHVASREGDRWLWVEPRKTPPRVQDLTPLLPEPVVDALWDPREDPRLFVRSSTQLIRIDPAAKTSVVVSAEAVRGLGLFRRRLYVVTREGTVERRDPEGHTVEVLLDDPTARARFQQGRFRVIVCDEDLAFFVSDRGTLLSTHSPHPLVEHGVRDVAWEPLARRLLVWQGERLGVIEVPRRSPDESPEPLILRWVVTAGGDLQQASWVYDGSHALVRDGDRAMLLELPREAVEGAVHVLARVQPDSAVRFVEETGLVYYVDPDSRSLQAMELVPR